MHKRGKMKYIEFVHIAVTVTDGTKPLI